MLKKELFLFLAFTTLALFAVSCREYEGLAEIEKDSDILVKVDGPSVSSIAVFTPGISPVNAEKVSENLFSFIRPASFCKVPDWYAVSPARTDLFCDAFTSVISAKLPDTQYPEGTEADKNSMISLTPGFNIGTDRNACAQKPDSILLALKVQISGLSKDSRVFSLSFTSHPDSAGLSGSVAYSIDDACFVSRELGNKHSISVLSANGVKSDGRGIAELTAVTFHDWLEYDGPVNVFVSTDNELYSGTVPEGEIVFSKGKMMLSLGGGFKKSAAVSFGFNDEFLFNTLSSSSSAKLIGSNGTESILECSSEGCVGKEESCFLRFPPNSFFKVPAISGKEVTGVLFQLTGETADAAKFNVFSGDVLLCTIEASTLGKNGALTALSLTDLPQELEITDLAGLKITAAGEESHIAGLVLTIIDYIDPHVWEDGHIDDNFNNLFDILL